MSYQVLARKWRPQTFDDVVGQEPVVRTLKRALDTERVAHAFLFTGSRGIGKTTLARLMAKALCCEKGVTPEPDGTCIHCKEIMNGSAVDVVEIDGASHTGVDDIRELREATRFQPQSCRFKVFIIDEVHMLSTSAFNALLKTLEEPPPHVKFIFATTEPHKIPVTILSRCQRYDFKRIKSSQIVGRLEYVLEKEGLKIDPAGLQIIALAAEGGMRDALSLTDQVLSFAGDGAGPDEVTEALGLIDRRTIVRTVDAIVARDAKVALAEVDRAFEQGHDLRQFAEAVCGELRNLNVSAAAGSIQGFADLSAEDLNSIDERAKKADPKDLQRLFSSALDGVDQIGETESPKLALELTVIRMCERPPVTEALAVSEALVRLDALARGRPVPPLSRGGGGNGGGGEAVRLVDETMASGGGRASAPSSAPSSAASPARAEPRREERPSAPEPGPAHAVRRPPEPEPMPTSAAEAAEAAEEPPLSGPVPTEASAPVPSQEGAAEEDEEDLEEADLGLELEDIDETWLHFVRIMERKTRIRGACLTHGVFLGTEPSSSGKRVKVAFSQSLHERTARDTSDHPELKEALKLFGDGAFLEVVAMPENPGPSVFQARRRAREKVQQALEEHAREHPVVKKAIELFGGEIRAVRP